MEITAGTPGGGNPGCNAGTLMQIIQSFSAGQGNAGVINGMSGMTDGNPFFQILFQQLTALLQGGNFGGDPSVAAKEELMNILQKLTGMGEKEADHLLSEMALLAMGNPFVPVNPENKCMSCFDSSAMAVSGEVMANDGSGHNTISQPAAMTTYLIHMLENGMKQEDLQGNRSISIESSVSGGKDFLAGAASSNLQSEKVLPDVSKDPLSIAGMVNNDLNQRKAGKLEPQIMTEAKLSAAADQEATPRKNPVKADMEFPKETPVKPDDAKQNIFSAATQTDKLFEKVISTESQLQASGMNVKAATSGKHAESDEIGAGKDKEPKILFDDAEASGQTSGKKTPTVHDGHRFEKKMDMASTEEKDGNSFQAVMDLTEKPKTESKSRPAIFEKTPDNTLMTSAAGLGSEQVRTDRQEVSATSIINRVAAEFRESILGEGGRVKIALSPPSLGALEMDVSVQNSKVKIMLIAESKDVQKVLSGNIETLKSSLQTQGLTIERCDVMMSDRRDEYHQGFNGQQAFGHDQTPRERNSRGESQDDKTLTRPVISSVQKPARHSVYTGPESISLFA